MLISLNCKKILICGLNGTGKTHLARHLSDFCNAFVITLNPEEWKDKEVVIGECQSIEDFKFWLMQYKKFLRKINCIILDDFDCYFESHLDSLPEFQELIYRNRHIGKGLTVIAITRRPQNIPTRYYEIFETLICFTLNSPNVVKKLNEIYQGLGDIVRQLPYKSYKFVIYEIGKNPVVSKI